MYFRSLGKILLVLLMLACSITSFAVDSLSLTNEMSIQLDQTEIVLAKGKTAKIKATLVGMDLPKRPKFKWNSSDKKVASVQQGTITAVNAGEVTITCSIQLDNSELTATCKVNVVVLVSSVKGSSTKFTIAVGESTTPQVKILPEKATNKVLRWSSSDTSIATVDNQGKITAVNGGTCKVSFEATDGSKKSGTVTVFVPTIKVIKSQYAINQLGTFTIPFYYYGDVLDSVTYTVKDRKIISVSSTNNKLNITPLSVGTTSITLNDKNSPASKQTIDITVSSSAIANAYKIMITSAKISKKYGLTNTDVKVQNNTGTYVDEIGIRQMFVDKYGELIYVGINSRKDYLLEIPSVTFRLINPLKNKSTVSIGELYSEYSNAKALLVAIDYFKTSDGTEYYIPESQLCWFFSEAGYVKFPTTYKNYKSPSKSDLTKSDSFRLGTNSIGFYLEYAFRIFLKNAGHLVVEVARDSIAEKSDIRADDLIVSMNGIKFIDDPFMIDRAKMAMVNGQAITCVIERNNELITVTLKK